MTPTTKVYCVIQFCGLSVLQRIGDGKQNVIFAVLPLHFDSDIEIPLLKFVDRLDNLTIDDNSDDMKPAVLVVVDGVTVVWSSVLDVIFCDSESVSREIATQITAVLYISREKNSHAFLYLCSSRA